MGVVNDLLRRTVLGFVQLIVALGVLLFGPAWTFDYWQAWVYLAVFAGSVALITIHLWRHDKHLLERRVNAGPSAEKAGSQIIIQSLAALAFLAMFIVPSLDHRFDWSHVPLAIVLAGDFLVVFGFWIVFLVFRENTYTSATIEVAKGQRVISTGPYALVRHPMYAGALVMLAGTPLALGSWWGLLLVVLMTLAITWRLLDEEKFLSKDLPGYEEYRQQVRYRLVPHVW
jgi:protein-S-isoprenylcysteine O-methyltransferase Ste14